MREREREERKGRKKNSHRDLLRQRPVPPVPAVQEVVGRRRRVRDEPQDHARVVAGLGGHRELVRAVQSFVHKRGVGVPGLGRGVPLSAQALGGEGGELARGGVDGGGDDVLIWFFLKFLF